MADLFMGLNALNIYISCGFCRLTRFMELTLRLSKSFVQRKLKCWRKATVLAPLPFPLAAASGLLYENADAAAEITVARAGAGGSDVRIGAD